jgi:hypothetical protein
MENLSAKLGVENFYSVSRVIFEDSWTRRPRLELGGNCRFVALILNQLRFSFWKLRYTKRVKSYDKFRVQFGLNSSVVIVADFRHVEDARHLAHHFLRSISSRSRRLSLLLARQGQQHVAILGSDSRSLLRSISDCITWSSLDSEKTFTMMWPNKSTEPN